MLEVQAPPRDVAQRMWSALRRPPKDAVTRDGADGPTAVGPGDAFVTGRIQGTDPVHFRLVGYRERQWFGRATRYIDPDEVLKPRLVGYLDGDEYHASVHFRIDAFQSCLSLWLLVGLSVMFAIGGAISGIVSGIPIPGITFLLLLFSFGLAVFAVNIWGRVDNAMADEAFLIAWLEDALVSQATASE